MEPVDSTLTCDEGRYTNVNSMWRSLGADEVYGPARANEVGEVNSGEAEVYPNHSARAG